MTDERTRDLKERIVNKLKKERNLTFREICDYVVSFGYKDWDVATTLPAMCKEGTIKKITKTKTKKKLFGEPETTTETRYRLK